MLTEEEFQAEKSKLLK
ncbi:MAG: hypothetical protein MKZ83_05370 [Candidatus Poseidoniia archaeon]|nr:hypothetical protein [Candidatus Poseidoniia archaeon]